MYNRDMGNTFITLGIIVLVIGIVINVMGKFQIPLLPGDIFIQKENFTFYFPIVTSILVSIVLTLLINMFR